MSIEALQWANNQTVGCPGAKAILKDLANYADYEGGSCFPSQQRLAEMSEMSTRTVSRHIKKLAELGFIKVHRKKGACGKLLNNSYTLLMDKKPEKPEDNLSCGDQKTNATKPEDNLSCHLTTNISPIEEEARTREGFIDLVSVWLTDGRFKDVAMEQAAILHQAGCAYDHWEAKNKHPQVAYQFSYFNNWLNTHIAKAGKAKTAPKRDKAATQPPINILGLQDWQRDIFYFVKEGAYRAWFADAEFRDGVLYAGTAYKAHYIRDKYFQRMKYKLPYITAIETLNA